MPMCRTACPTLLGVAFLLTAATVSAQVVVPSGNLRIGPRDRVPPPRTGTGSVKGRVVDGTTGAAIARARVVMQSGARASVLTDASGAFAFANLPPGPFTIGVDKSTYLSGRYPTPGRTIRSNTKPIVLADGQALDGLNIPLFHGGIHLGPCPRRERRPHRLRTGQRSSRAVSRPSWQAGDAWRHAERRQRRV